MGANDAAEMLESAKAEVLRLEANVRDARAFAEDHLTPFWNAATEEFRVGLLAILDRGN